MQVAREFPIEKGIYLLCMYAAQPIEVAVGKHRHVCNQGYYYYAGSAHGSGGLAARLKRHCSNNKKKHWHIDYLLEQAALWSIFIWKTEKEMEHQLAGTLAADGTFTMPVPHFGSSDCTCYAHLFFTGKKPKQVSRLIQSALPGVAAVRYRIPVNS